MYVRITYFKSEYEHREECECHASRALASSVRLSAGRGPACIRVEAGSCKASECGLEVLKTHPGTGCWERAGPIATATASTSHGQIPRGRAATLTPTELAVRQTARFMAGALAALHWGITHHCVLDFDARRTFSQEIGRLRAR